MKTACLVSLLSALCALAPLCAEENNELLEQACWIWYDKDTNAIDPSIARAEFTFTKELALDGPVSEALLRITAESVYSLSINGKAVGSGDKPLTLDSYDIKPLLIPGKNELAVKAKTKTWFAGLFVAGTIKLSNGKIVSVISDDTWNCTIEGATTPRKAERVIRGINGGWWNNCNRVMEMPADWYRLNTEVAAPGIAWAKPWAGAKVRVLAIHPRARQWDIVELSHRTDMELTSVFCDRQEKEGERAPFFPDTKGWRKKDVVESLTKALAGSYDVLIVDQIDEEIFYEVVANQAARRKRACILAIIPGDICELAVEECDKTLAGGDGKPLIDRIRKMVATFSDFGVTASMIEQRLKHNLDATTEQELAILRKTYRAIADGFGSRADYFEAVGQERPPAPPKETKGAAAAQENPTPPPATAGEPPPRPAAPTRAPEAHAEVVEEEKKPAPKTNGKHKIVQKTVLEDKESVTLIASVVEFKTRVINKKPSVEASIEAPEFKGTVYHIGCCAIHREGETDALVPPPEWQIKKPVKIALHGTKTGSMGVVAIVDLLNFVPEDEIQF